MKKPRGAMFVAAILMVVMVGALSISPSSATPTSYISHQFLPGPDYLQTDARARLMISGDAFGVPLTQVEWKDPLGVSARCRPLLGGCVTRNTYSVLGTLLASTHEFDIAGQGRLTGTYTAIASYCTSQYGMACTGQWRELFRANFTIKDAQPTSTLTYLPHVIR